MKRLRKEMKELNGFNIKAKADYRVSHQLKKVAYFKVKDKFNAFMTVAVPCTRQCIVNATKLPYRRLKKEITKRKGRK